MMALIIKHSLSAAEKPTRLPRAVQTEPVLFAEDVIEKTAEASGSFAQSFQVLDINPFVPNMSPIVKSDTPVAASSRVVASRAKPSRKTSRSKSNSKLISRKSSPPADPEAATEPGHVTQLSSVRQSQVLTTNLHVLSARNKRIYGLSA